jgi:hypothetical protein
MEYEQAQGRQVYDVHEKDLGYDITSLDLNSGELRLMAEARGKQELFTRQSPQKLKVLREHALIESAISSNRIEGVEVDPSRIKTILFGKQLLRDRDEEEVRGYRD